MSKLKKLLSLTLSVLLILSAVPVTLTALAATSYISDDWYLIYTVLKGEATITDCDTSISGDYTIPDTLGGYPVTAIGSGAFSSCNSLKSIVISDSVISIGSYAFQDCTSLENVMIGNSVSTIGNYAFWHCTSLKIITMPDNVTTIYSEAFDDTAYYNDESNWEDGVLYLGNHLIKAQTSISGSYEIKEGTKTIASDAFVGCSLLTEIAIPETIISINGGAFWACTSLDSIEIPNGVTSIGGYTFCACTSLTNVTIPNSVISIGECAFAGCTSLTGIIIPDSVSSIVSQAFWNCTGLTDITIPKDVTSIGTQAFGYYKSAKITDFTINGYINTAAETYAKSNGFKFNAIYCDEHTYGDGVVTEATCTEDGSITYVCTVCNYSYTEIIEATGHSYGDWVVVTEAAVEQEGLEQRECSVCGEIETRVIEKIIEEEPTTAEPTTAEPTTAEPTTAEPTTAEPTTEEPTTAEPTTAEPTTAEPTTEEPTTAEPTTEEPTTEEEPTTAEPTTEEPTTEEPTTEEPGMEEPTTEAPVFTVSDESVVINEAGKQITISADTSLEAFAAMIISGSANVIGVDGNELTSDALIGTGCKVQTLDSDGNVVSEYTVIVPSDVDGNGKVTAADARLALRAAAQLDTLENVYLVAADFDADSAIKPSDARSILRVAAKLD